MIFALSAAVVGTGCGGDSSSAAKTGVLSTSSTTSSTTPSLDKAEYLKLANAACRKARAGINQRIAAYEHITAKEKPGSYVDVTHWVFLPTVEEEIARVLALGWPTGEKERIRVLMAAERTAVDAVAVMEKVPSIAVAERHFVKPGRMLRAYGLTACANGNRR